jgi:hypothetical protein
MGDPGEKGVTPFPGEEVIMTVYDGRLPLRGRHCIPNLSLGTPTHCS